MQLPTRPWSAGRVNFLYPLQHCLSVLHLFRMQTVQRLLYPHLFRLIQAAQRLLYPHPSRLIQAAQRLLYPHPSRLAQTVCQLRFHLQPHFLRPLPELLIHLLIPLQQLPPSPQIHPTRSGCRPGRPPCCPHLYRSGRLHFLPCSSHNCQPDFSGYHPCVSLQLLRSQAQRQQKKNLPASACCPFFSPL